MRPKKPNIGMKCFGPRVMSALQVWLWLLIFIFQNEFRISYCTEPGYLDFDNLPDTNFSCAGKVIGGYYADLETDCQMFHVCTIGQHEEPMDIKFLCLNGTVFDQETRVCERVDEVDCSKSERFYSLNLELYGNTAPPIIKSDSIENSEEDIDDEYSDVYEEPSTTTAKTTKMTTTTTTTTKRPSPTTTNHPYHTTPKPTYYQTTLHEYQHESEGDDEDDVYDIIDDNTSADVSNHSSSEKSKEHYNHYNVDSQVPRPVGNNNQYEDSDSGEDLKPTIINDNSQIFSPEEFIYHHNKQSFALKSPAISFQQHSYTSNGQNSHVTVTTHTGKGNYNTDPTKTQNTRIQNTPVVNKLYLPNNSGQSNTKMYVDKSPTYNNYQNYNNQKRVPLVPPPNSQIQAPTGHPGLSTPKHPKQPLYYNFRKPPLTPQGFKPSHLNQPHQSPKPNQQLKLNQNFQPSERHEISVEREYEFEKIIPNIPQAYLNNNYDQKRSKAVISVSEQYESSPVTSVESRTTTTTPYYNTWATRSNNYTKSLPSVIITASASVSDSNGKKLNYSVGNIVHAVKPLIQTNYDDYKESDVALDPFFLDVPKLKKGRKKRSSRKNESRTKRHYIIKVYKYDPSVSDSVITPNSNISTRLDDPLISVTTNTYPEINISKETPKETTTTVTVNEQSTPWIPPDYVDDNYEPIVYQETFMPKTEENLKTQVIKTVSTPSVVNKYISNNINTSNNVDEKVHVNSEQTTNNYIGRTTLDLVKIENTTPNIVLNNYTQKADKRYRLLSVSVVNLLEKDCENCKYSCKDKKYHKFYPDKNCRTFHMCSPSVNVTRVLNLVFICDLGYYFNSDNCTPSKPNDCEYKKL